MLKNLYKKIYKNYADQKLKLLTQQASKEVEREKRNDLLNEIRQLSSNIKNKKVDL